MSKSKTKKRKNSDYKTSFVTTEESKDNKKEKKSTFAKAQDRAQKRQQKNKPKEKREKGRLKEYFKGVRLEMKKVVWPTRPELGSYTVVVIAVCAAFALFFWGVDSAVLAGIKAICF